MPSAPAQKDATAGTPAKKAPPLKTLNRKNIQKVNVTGNILVAKIPVDHTLEDIIKPEYWAHVAGESFVERFYNEIICEWEDHSKVVKLYVRECDNSGAKVEILSASDFENGSIVKAMKAGDAKTLKAVAPAVENNGGEGKGNADGKANTRKPEDDDPDYSFRWVDNNIKFRIIRLSDNSIIEENIPSKEAAKTFITEYKAKAQQTT